jgi:hypothetical protein
MPVTLNILCEGNNPQLQPEVAAPLYSRALPKKTGKANLQCSRLIACLSLPQDIVTRKKKLHILTSRSATSQ